ncbi:MAG TPA: hypothetical protein VG406_08875 [Isosphaeraceae bacterium]|jgi:hypothetical protein|nr:hypothetical protein [Isosphaeraceae bacterium]
MIPDYLPNPKTTKPQIVPSASELVRGQLKITPVGAVGSLTWSVGSSFTLWAQLGTGFEQITDGETMQDFKVPPNPISLRVEGIKITGQTDTISVTFTPKVGEAPPERTATFQVYSGLVLPASPQRAALVTQLQKVTSFAFTVDGSGNVTITSGPTKQAVKDRKLKWMNTVRGLFLGVLDNTNAKFNGGVTVIRTGASAVVNFDNFILSQIDTDDIDFVLKKNLRLSSVFLIHAIREEYYKWTQDRPEFTQGDKNLIGAHDQAIIDELPILNITSKSENSRVSLELNLYPNIPLQKYIHYKWIFDNGKTLDFYAEEVPDATAVQAVRPGTLAVAAPFDPNLNPNPEVVDQVIIGTIPPP